MPSSVVLLVLSNLYTNFLELYNIVKFVAVDEAYHKKAEISTFPTPSFTLVLTTTAPGSSPPSTNLEEYFARIQ